MMRILFLSICLLLNALHCAEIPVEHSDKINCALEKVFHVNAPDSIEQVLGGFSSSGLYKIRVDGKPYIVRFPSKYSYSLEDNQRELHAMEIASSEGLAPRIIYADADEGIIIMDYIDTSKNRESFNPFSEANLKLLGTNMRKIHEGPPFKESISLFDLAKYFETAITDKKPCLLSQVSDLLNELQWDLKDLLIKKPCHNDLNPNNILYSEDKIYFIDWEAASQADPFFDLATPIVLYAMNEKQEKTVMDAYFGRELLSGESYKFHKMKAFTMIFYGYALVCISQLQGEALMTEDEIESLPPDEEILKEGNMQFPKGIQQYGFALLRRALSFSAL